MKPMKLGAILQACRERAGMTQTEIAEKLGRTRTSISRLENDKRFPDVSTIAAWTQATGATEVMVAFICGMDGLSIMQNILQIMGG
ncbi:XRE family transcriptional regulator [Paenibacillaceae bacterium]|nr:XRE family transcriptional regulator [Paenibacillaceae bacterium]